MRLDFRWKEQLEEEQNKAKETHMVHQLLLTNILPQHVGKLLYQCDR